MNRHETLRRLLLGEPVDASEKEFQWATIHEPLLSPSMLSLKGRRLNHFCVGSDPEFSLKDRDDLKIDAYSAGLRVGLVAGCDQNERLVELRPWPSPSVVEHVAGILTALRWMVRVYNASVGQYKWRAGAYFAGDGMGGHIHFGRKRPTRAQEIKGLDALAKVLLHAGLFPENEWKRRIAGDQRGQRYGAYGDFRIQAHGYEYRTLPSWLQSPTTAFVVLAASKLTVLDPSLVENWESRNIEHSRHLLRGLAKYYKSRDDDAYLLYHVLTMEGDVPFLVDYARDFAHAWGITRERDLSDAGVILPASIPPTKDEVAEIQEHLLTGIPLTFRKTAPVFPTRVPRDYTWIPSFQGGGRHHGFGDLLHNMVVANAHMFNLAYAADNRLHVQGEVVRRWNGSERALLTRYDPLAEIRPIVRAGGSGPSTLMVPRPLCEAQTIAGFRAILFNSGLFPLWTVKDVTADSYNLWLKAHPHDRGTTAWRTL